MSFERFQPAESPKSESEPKPETGETSEKRGKGSGLAKWAKKTAALAGVAAIGVAGTMKEAEAGEFTDLLKGKRPSAERYQPTRTVEARKKVDILGKGSRGGLKLETVYREETRRRGSPYRGQPQLITKKHTVGAALTFGGKGRRPGFTQGPQRGKR